MKFVTSQNEGREGMLILFLLRWTAVRWQEVLSRHAPGAALSRVLARVSRGGRGCVRPQQGSAVGKRENTTSCCVIVPFQRPLLSGGQIVVLWLATRATCLMFGHDLCFPPAAYRCNHFYDGSEFEQALCGSIQWKKFNERMSFMKSHSFVYAVTT